MPKWPGWHAGGWGASLRICWGLPSWGLTFSRGLAPGNVPGSHHAKPRRKITCSETSLELFPKHGLLCRNRICRDLSHQGRACLLLPVSPKHLQRSQLRNTGMPGLKSNCATDHFPLHRASSTGTGWQHKERQAHSGASDSWRTQRQKQARRRLWNYCTRGHCRASTAQQLARWRGFLTSTTTTWYTPTCQRDASVPGVFGLLH
jgi:hypothetical protein